MKSIKQFNKNNYSVAGLEMYMRFVILCWLSVVARKLFEFYLVLHDTETYKMF